MSQANWEADKMLDVYIYDYLVKRNLQESAKAFQAEGKVSPDPVAIDAPGGFLFEWWSVFWDIFIARTNEKHSDAAASYLEKSREQQHPQHQRQPQQQQQQQIQMQQLLLQRHVQQQQQQHQQQQLQPRVGTHLLNGSPNASGGVDSLMRPESGIASALATKMYEEQLKLPIQRDSLDETSIKQRFTENVGQLLDPSHASILSSAATTGQPARQGLHGLTGASSGDIHHVQNKNQQFTGAIQDIKTDSSTELNPRSIGLDGTLIGVEGPNQNGSNLTLKGWPLTGLDQFRTGILQQQKSLMQSSHSYNQIQFLNPQQQQLLLQAQHNLASPLAGDLDSRRLRMLLNNRNNLLGKDGNGNSIVDIVSNVVSPLQATCNALPCTDKDMLIKSKEECEYLIELAKPHMERSTVVDSATGHSKDSRVRTSSGMFLRRGHDETIQAIEKRIADFTFIPVEHGEGLQVLHYEVGQKYEPHYDYFLDEFNTKNGGQRIATLLIYLSDVEEGGETVFPAAKVNGSSLPWYHELSECGKKGLSVKPKMGDALLFWSMRPDGSLDPSSLHGGCPVIKGNKWSSTKWMHVSEYKV